VEFLTTSCRYRKINLFDEPNLTPGDPNQRVTFKTDFGVTFAVFTCFDIVFDNPASTVLENNDVTDVVYPSAWISIMPFFTCGYSTSPSILTIIACSSEYPTRLRHRQRCQPLGRQLRRAEEQSRGQWNLLGGRYHRRQLHRRQSEQ
jgi:hypothetical protein